ncbi:hypothetical protein Poly21_11850 [Allorhodopirellula heiligendammensis]|uniref:Uncharacterized protein n=1 Tax=Allorhodopirellula heiligendammensis TaxID=2714739 RepID=A0A5C6C6I9_9BACT|nr:hypothetical protein Poly21_11850 [Allorhodopirellula heiligendammensis]
MIPGPKECVAYEGAIVDTLAGYRDTLHVFLFAASVRWQLCSQRRLCRFVGCDCLQCERRQKKRREVGAKFDDFGNLTFQRRHRVVSANRCRGTFAITPS